jgi:glutathione peroxidase
MSNIYQFLVEDTYNNKILLKQYSGYLILVVNTASKCGFNYQMKELDTLYKKYKNQKFVVLGFPCDQFFHQEFRDNKQIQDVCQIKFAVTFPIMAKIDVNGKNTIPLYKYLKQSKTGIFGTKMIKWNFTKFLINRQGEVVRRFAPITNIRYIEEYIKLII